jgi:hypothetical protein
MASGDPSKDRRDADPARVEVGAQDGAGQAAQGVGQLMHGTAHPVLSQTIDPGAQGGIVPLGSQAGQVRGVHPEPHEHVDRVVGAQGRDAVTKAVVEPGAVPKRLAISLLDGSAIHPLACPRIEGHDLQVRPWDLAHVHIEGASDVMQVIPAGEGHHPWTIGYHRGRIRRLEPHPRGRPRRPPHRLAIIRAAGRAHG